MLYQEMTMKKIIFAGLILSTTFVFGSATNSPASPIINTFLGGAFNSLQSLGSSRDRNNSSKPHRAPVQPHGHLSAAQVRQDHLDRKTVEKECIERGWGMFQNTDTIYDYEAEHNKPVFWIQATINFLQEVYTTDHEAKAAQLQAERLKQFQKN
jgi:hypothetical protein